MAQITLKKLAELSGLSIRTVSRVLKDQANVVPEKRELVLELARKYHYQPNMAARNLRLQKKSFVGILSSNFQTEVFLQKVNDLERRLFSAGFYPILGRPDNFSSDFQRMMQDWPGVMDYVVVFELPPHHSELDLRSFPLDFILVDRGLHPDHHCLMIDRASGVCEAVEHLIRTGRRRILHCGMNPSRKTGVLRAFEELGTEFGAKPMFLESAAEFEDGYSLGPVILSHAPDALFFDTDRMAAGFLKYAAEHAVAIPRDVAVVGFDDDLICRMSAPALSSVAHPIAEINTEIVSIITNAPAEKVNKTFPTRFVLRESC